MIKSIKIDKEWVRCNECGHKLFKITSQMPPEIIMQDLQGVGIEIKCHSCKMINKLY